MHRRFMPLLLHIVAWLAGLPGPALRRRLAEHLADREHRRNSKRARVVACNLRLAGLDPALARPALAHGLLTFLESLRYWSRPAVRNLREVVAVEGLEHLAAARAAGPVLVVAPHHGNWELLAQWLAAQGPLTLIYTRGKQTAVDAFLRRARERDGVRAVAADAHGLKPLMRALHHGAIVGITPDQCPTGAGGLWSPFFGVPALTMTLLPRLALKTGAQLVMAAAERQPDGRFVVRLRPLPATVTSGSLQCAVDAMNLEVEALARRDPAQYQWTYKRFKGQRPGEARVNPYWPECY